MTTIPLRLLACCLLMAGALSGADAPASPWPLDIPIPGGVITLYQPQLEKLTGNVLTGRAAASYLVQGKEEESRVFGALWFTAVLDIDREHNLAVARQMTITKVLTPKGEKAADEGAEAKKAIQDAVIAQGIQIDLDRLTATLEEQDGDGEGAGELSQDVPRILIRTEPAVLVVLDGEAQMKDVDGVKRAVNSPAFLATDPAGTWWLLGEQGWLSAPALDGPWAIPAAAPAAALVAAAAKGGFTTDVKPVAGVAAPAVILANRPTELVVFDGKPALAPVGDGKLLGATNTGTPVLVEVASGNPYLLLAGRWYRADTLTDGATWELISPDRLPAAFAAIPAGSEWGEVRASVAGTPEAEDAVAQQQIPQTARIPRTATITVAFDGEPKWVAITGRDAAYAENTADAVFRIAGPRYYACRYAVWYEGADPRGPLAVATSVPEALRRLPADCPWSNCSYAQIYDSTPEYIWCGYTPAYIGWYSWYGCPVYGTGYWYHGWYGAAYYPRPVTYGVGIAWSSNGGWGVAVGVGGPHWAIGISGSGGWYGSGGVNNINIDNSNNINIGNGNRPANRPATRPSAGLYDRVPGAERPKARDAAERPRAQPATGAAARPARENLAVDRDGNIGRPAADGSWQVRDGGSWKPQPKAEPAARPAQVPSRPAQTPAPARPAPAPAPAPARPAQKAQPAPRPAPSFEQTQQMRNRGEQRAQQRSAPSRPAGGGGGGGGGGRRR